MYSGISGMKNFQTKLDVIGNNIANVNTYGFKKGRVTFKDAISQSISGASGASDTRGGKNPTQVGLGATLASVDTVDTQASMQTTGRTLDLAIDGDGYFVVSDSKDGKGNLLYTRAGNFYLDNDGNLVNSDGYYVMQVETDENGNVGNSPILSSISIPNGKSKVPDGNGGTKDLDGYASFTINSNGEIWGVKASEGTANNDTNQGEENESEKIATLDIARFNNPSGLTKVGGNLFQQSANSGTVNHGISGKEGRGSVNAGYLEMSNVDLSEEFTEMIVAQRGFQANTRIITTSDEILQELINLKR
jgi:flagellar hook protein FlgE